MYLQNPSVNLFFSFVFRLETDIVHHNGGSAVQGSLTGDRLQIPSLLRERAEREVGAIIHSKQYQQSGMPRPVHSDTLPCLPSSRHNIQLHCVPIINLPVMLIQASVTIDSELTKVDCLFSAVLSQCGLCHIKSPHLPYVIPLHIFSQFKNIFGHKDLMTT